MELFTLALRDYARRMRWLVLVAIITLACGGGIQTYWSNDDAGHCVEHASQQYCHVSTGPCDDGGPANTDAGDLGNTASIVTCTP